MDKAQCSTNDQSALAARRAREAKSRADALASAALRLHFDALGRSMRAVSGARDAAAAALIAPTLAASLPAQTRALATLWLAAPYDLARSAYAAGVVAGAIPNSMISAHKFDKALKEMEAVFLGSLSRPR